MAQNKQQNYPHIGGTKRATYAYMYVWPQTRQTTQFAHMYRWHKAHKICIQAWVAKSKQISYLHIGGKRQAKEQSRQHKGRNIFIHTWVAKGKQQKLQNYLRMGGDKQATEISTHTIRLHKGRNMFIYTWVAKSKQQNYLQIGGQKQATKLSTDRWPYPRQAPPGPISLCTVA